MLNSLQQAFTRRFEALDSTHPCYTIRQQAWQHFNEQGLPTAKDEAYRYTPITRLLTAYFESEHPTTSIQTPEADIASVGYHDTDAYHILLINGRISDKHTRLGALNPLIQVLTFQEAYQQQHRVFLEHFSRHAQHKSEAFTALNTALFEEGFFIQIADHAIIDKPLLLTVSSTRQPITYPRLLVVAGNHSQASIITSWQTTGFTNAVAEVILQEDAQVNYYTLQTHLDIHSIQVNTTQCYQARHSILNTYTFTWSGAVVRNNLYTVIDAPYSETNMYGLYCLHGQQHVDNCTEVDHRKPNTYSNELYKGIMMDASTGVFNGRIYVRPEAQKTNSFQTNNNLVLSNHATLHTKPQLEIWADDVKCSHGATTGQLDEEQLFYLQSRGLHKDTAHSMLRQAFANEVISKVPWISLRTQLHNSLLL